MAYKRKAPRAPRSKRPYKKARMTRPVRPKLPVMNVQRTWRHFHWTPATTVTTDFWQYLTIQLANVPNFAEFTALFDTYRINTIKWTFRPRYDSFAGNDTVDTTLPGVTNQGGCYAHVVVDPKSSVSPSGLYTSSNLNIFLENGKVKTYNATKPFSILVKYPCIADDINGVSSSKFVRAPFISTSNPTISHRTAHVFMQDVNLTGSFGQAFDVFCTMSLTFKGQR